MAKKLDRPFTLAEAVYQFAYHNRWEELLNEHHDKRYNGRFDKFSLNRMREKLGPKMARLRDRIVEAKRFVIPTELHSTLIGPGHKLDLNKLEAKVETARLPYPFMWLEVEDGSFGYLLCRIRGDDPTSYSVTIFINDPKQNFVHIMGATMMVGEGVWTRMGELGRHLGYEDHIKRPERKHILRLWGITDDEEVDDRSFMKMEQHASASVDTYMMYPLMQLSKNDEKDELGGAAWDQFTIACEKLRGFLPFIIDLVGLLNSPAVTLDTVVMKGHYQYKLKNHPFLTSNTIQLNIAPHKVRKFLNDRIAEHLRSKHRAHEVRGFWRHHLSAAACDRSNHDWVPDVDDSNLHQCSRCAGTRRWIKEHVRGDASLGWVQHSYKVTYEPERV